MYFLWRHKRITKRHEVEHPYIKALLKEWQLYVEHMEEKPRIKEIHLGGGTRRSFLRKTLRHLLTDYLN